tara:strand:- start:737 stop:1558 length:822 start_codon:yes stop_codon:yes gene_type:complete
MSDSTLPDLAGIYNSYIQIENQKNVQERYTDKTKTKYFHASSAGMCARKHYYSVIDEPASNESNDKSQRVMRLGTVVHDDIQSAFRLFQEKESSKEKEISNSVLYKDLYKDLYNNYKGIKNITMEEEIIIDDWNVRGFYDLVIEMVTDEVFLIDFKTIGSYGYKLKFGRNPRENESDHQELQLATYGKGIKDKYGRLDGMFLFYYNKDSSMVKQKIVPMSYLAKAERYWKQLKGRMNMGMPPIQDGISPVQSWECNYCKWKDTCFNTIRRNDG